MKDDLADVGNPFVGALLVYAWFVAISLAGYAGVRWIASWEL